MIHYYKILRFKNVSIIAAVVGNRPLQKTLSVRGPVYSPTTSSFRILHLNGKASQTDINILIKFFCFHFYL